MWNSGNFAKLINSVREVSFPPIISALYRNATEHWCGPVHTKTFDVLRTLMEADEHLFSESSAKHRRDSEEEGNKEALRLRKWAALQDLFEKKTKDREAAAARAQKKPAKRSTISKANAKRRESIPFQKRRLDLQRLEGANYGVSVGSETLDVDLQVLVLNKRGEIISVVSSFNFTALNAAIVHTAGMPTSKPQKRNGTLGRAAGLWITLPRLPAAVRHLFFLAVATDGYSSRRSAAAHVQGCVVRVVNGDDGAEIMEVPVELDSSGISIVASIEMDDERDWNLSRVAMMIPLKSEASARTATHYTDVLDSIGSLMREKLPSATRPQRVCLGLETGAAADYLQGLAPRNVFIGAGWDFKDRGNSEELGLAIDVSAALFGAGGKELAVVCAENPEELGVRHSGSGLLSAGVAMVLDNIAEQVSQIYLVAHVSTPGVTYEIVQNPTCRIIDDKGACMLHYSIKEHSWQSGLILGRLYVESARRRWSFQAIGRYCGGSTCKDEETAKELQSLLRKSVWELQRQTDNMKPVASTSSGRLMASI